MRWFWHTFIATMLDALRPEVIVEIGAEHGEVTALLVAWASEHDAVVHSIDPSPTFDVAALESAHPGALSFHRSTSLSILSEIGNVDLVLQDGDHNWYTVLNELRQIEFRADRDGRLPPVVLLHDVGWPYARRDLYYNPDAIPPERRHEYGVGGLEPGNPGLSDTGLNVGMFNALVEGGPANGVVTAVEDFISETPRDWSWTTLPGLYGLGLLVPQELVEAQRAVAEVVLRMRDPEFLRAHCEVIETGRIESLSAAYAHLAAVEREAEERVRGLTTHAEEMEVELRRVQAVYRERADEAMQLGKAVSDRDIELALRWSQLRTGESELSALRTELDAARRASAEMNGSITWKAYRRIRNRAVDRLGGPSSLLVRVPQASLRGAARAFRARKESRAQLRASDHVWSPVLLPEFVEPLVSLIIPVHTGAALTDACLRSIAERTSKVSYEVILIDDGADEDTRALLAQVEGARIVVNEDNLGYLRSVNRAAALARGQWLVLCNNDIEVCDGWLTALLEVGESSSDIAVVTPRYLYPDGSLCEAGAIIWSDGTGMNYGRGQPPHLFHYRFRREVDYGSAAALLVRASFWLEAGGYDERFVPMYYEDADLCFQARERGLRVVYEPGATVVHAEGGTAGTDLTSGAKRHQEENRSRFVDKWRDRLADQPRPETRNLRLAANRSRGPRVLVVDYRIPAWDRDAGSLRMKAILEALISLGCRVTLLPDDRQVTSPYEAELGRLGVETWAGDVNVGAELEALGPELELVILSRPHTASRWLDVIRDLAPAAAVVYDTVDLHWLRELRRGGGEGVADITPGSKAAAVRELELAMFRACDATLVVTDAERRLVESDVPGACVWIAPTINAVRRDAPKVHHREGVVFVGGFDHPPNIEGVIRLVKRVMPLVWRRIGPVPVTIVGAAPPPEVSGLAGGQVQVTGWVAELEPLLDRARVMAAPLTWGAGLKGKVTQALAAGLPVVTTSIGAEGLDTTDGQALFIADDDAGLAERIVSLLSDDEVWTRMAAAGQALADERFSPKVIRDTLDELLRAAPALRSRDTFAAAPGSAERGAVGGRR